MQDGLVKKMQNDVRIYNIFYGEKGKQIYIERLVNQYNILQKYKDKYGAVLTKVKEKLEKIKEI